VPVSARVLVSEANHALSSTLRKYLESAGYTVDTTESAEESLARVRQSTPDVVICGVAGMDGEALCRRIKEIASLVPVALLYPPEEQEPDQRAVSAGADSYLVGPIKRGNLLSCVGGLLRIRELSAQVAAFEEEHDRRLQAPGPVQTHDLAEFDFDFFKRLLLMEVKRSRRYQYPLAFLLAAVDRFREVTTGMVGKDQARFMGKVLALAVKNVRDVDLCVLFAEDRFLVFMPHTAPEGAQIVAERLCTRIREFESEGVPKVTVSIGLAGYSGQGNVSFGKLLKDATGALKDAQTRGGDQVSSG